MTLQAFGQQHWPRRVMSGNTSSNGLGISNITFDSATDRLGWVGWSPVADTVAKVYFRINSNTTGCTFLIQIESILNGRPNGIIAGGASGTVVVADTVTGWQTVTITTPPTLTKGQEFAIVMTVSSGTPNLTIGGDGVSNGSHSYMPATIVDTGAGTWAWGVTQLAWVVEMTTAGVVYLPTLAPLDGTSETAFNSSSSPDEYALKFSIPIKCRCSGISVFMSNIAAAADFSLSLWPASSSVDGDALTQIAIDGDWPFSTSADGYFTVMFPDAVELAANTTYYLGVRADTANNIAIGRFGVPTGVTNALRGFGNGSDTCYQSTRAWTAGTAGAWTDLATTLPLISLVIDQLDDGAGGAGGGAKMAGFGGGLAG